MHREHTSFLTKSKEILKTKHNKKIARGDPGYLLTTYDTMVYLKDCYGNFDLNVDPANTVGQQLTANDGGDDGGTMLDTSAS